MASWTIQTFDDLKIRGDKNLSQTFVYDENRIKELNSKGAAICFVPNPQVDPVHRSIVNTAALRYITLDLDVAKIEDKLSKVVIESRKEVLFDKIKNLVIQPNLIIETKHGYQPIWKLAAEIPLNSESIRLQINERYQDLIRGFTTLTGIKSEGDSICRVIRLPGKIHLKDPNDPFLISVTSLSKRNVTLEEFEKAYPPIKRKTSISLSYQQQGGESNIQRIINYPLQEVLNKLSGKAEVNYEHFTFRSNSNGSIQLAVNEKITSQWIDSVNNTIGGAGPGQGNPTIIQFVQWYGIHCRGEDEITARNKAIKTLIEILGLTNKNPEAIHKNEDVHVNDNGGCKHSVYFELTQSKQRVITELTKCNYRTSIKQLVEYLTELFMEWESYPEHWQYIAQTYNPLAMNRTIKQIIKYCNNGHKIMNPAGLFTMLIKRRSRRKSF